MTAVPGSAPQTLSLVCDTCGHAVDGIESSVDHWPVIWALISRQGWAGSPLAIGPHHCPQCFGATAEGADRGARRGDEEWGAALADEPQACVVRLRGQLDILFAAELAEALRDAGNRHRNVVLDLRDVRLLDSTGISQLVQVKHSAERRGGQLCLAAPSTFILTVLETMRLAAEFHTFADTAGALRWLEGVEPSRL